MDWMKILDLLIYLIDFKFLLYIVIEDIVKKEELLKLNFYKIFI